MIPGKQKFTLPLNKLKQIFKGLGEKNLTLSSFEFLSSHAAFAQGDG